MQIVLFIKQAHRVELSHLPYEDSGHLIRRTVAALRERKYIAVANACMEITPWELMGTIQDGVTQTKWYDGCRDGTYFPILGSGRECQRSMQPGDIVVRDRNERMVELHVATATGFKTFLMERGLFDDLLPTD